MADPRLLQILVLSSLALYGAFGLELEIRPFHAAVTVVVALLTEAAGRRLRGEAFDPRSPLITALSLTLLLRTASPGVAALGALFAVGSKFLIRARGGHVFNPANFALVALLLTTDRAWVSSGQWGHVALLSLLLVGAGQLVIQRAQRGDVTWTFLATWSALLLARAAWLGDPLAIPWHQLQNGALLVFAFFMISDPRTTPRSRAGRSVFAVAVAVAGFVLVYGHYEPNGLLFALAGTAPLVPLLDRWLPGPVYLWNRTTETHHATHPARFSPAAPGLR